MREREKIRKREKRKMRKREKKKKERHCLPLLNVDISNPFMQR